MRSNILFILHRKEMEDLKGGIAALEEFSGKLCDVLDATMGSRRTRFVAVCMYWYK